MMDLTRSVFFLNVGPPKEDIFFWPLFMVYISVISDQKWDTAMDLSPLVYLQSI